MCFTRHTLLKSDELGLYSYSSLYLGSDAAEHHEKDTLDVMLAACVPWAADSTSDSMLFTRSILGTSLARAEPSRDLCLTCPAANIW